MLNFDEQVYLLGYWLRSNFPDVIRLINEANTNLNAETVGKVAERVGAILASEYGWDAEVLPNVTEAIVASWELGA